MKCEGCENSFSRAEAKNIKTDLLGYQVTCPTCNATLVPDKKSLVLKYLGLGLSVIGMLVVLEAIPVKNFIWYVGSSILVLVGAICTVVGVMKAKQVVKT